jgi:SAM-dependent methyltransferase
MIDISEPTSCSIEQSSCCASSGEDDWANCVAGTMREDELIELIQNAGFKDVKSTGLTHYTTAKTTQGATFQATKIPADTKRKEHWDTIFATKDYTQVLWHQHTPEFSLKQIKLHTDSKNDAIIDIGCGASFLADELLHNGYSDITLLDVSDKALEIVKKRLNILSDNITFICSDIISFQAPKKYKFWHDRAVFHFLLSAKERKQYFRVMYDALEENAVALIGTFSEEGPKQCSGLDIIQYNDDKVKSELVQGLNLVESMEIIHNTPKDTQQSFRFFLIQKT